MLNFIKRLFRIKIKNTPEGNPPTTPQTARGASPVGRGQKVEQVAFDNAISLINLRLDNSNYLMGIVLIALLICFITLFFGYWQFAGTSYNDYSQKIKQLNDERMEQLQNRVTTLENATQSAK